MTPPERSDVRNYERALGIQLQYRELPSLPRPIGLVTGCPGVSRWDEYQRTVWQRAEAHNDEKLQGSRLLSLNLLSKSLNGKIAVRGCSRLMSHIAVLTATYQTDPPVNSPSGRPTSHNRSSYLSLKRHCDPRPK